MSDYGIFTEAGSVRFERLLAAPIDRVWDHLVLPELRARWFAGGEMDLRPGGRIELIFHNSALASPGEAMPEKFQCYEGMRAPGRIVRIDPPRLLVFDWEEENGPATEVTWQLDVRGDQTQIILIHRRLADRAALVDVAGGWHLHLDALEDLLASRQRRPFWSRQEVLEREYDERTPPA